MTALNTTNVHVHRKSPAKLCATGLHDIHASAHAYGPRDEPAGSARPGAFARNLGKLATQPPRSHHAPAAPWRNQTTTRDYASPELAPYTGRPGAMDAFDKPSRVGTQLFYRDGRVEAVA